MAVPFEELPGSGARSGGKITRLLKVAWADMDALEAELLGSSSLAANLMRFTAPASYPGKPDYLAIDVAFEPTPDINHARFVLRC